MAKVSIPLIIVLAFAFITGFALLHKGLPPTHDGEYHVVRFYEFDKALRDGNIYPRWAPDLNYGYGVPLFNYNYPLPTFFSSLLHSFGVSFIDAFKLNLFTAVLLAGLFFYLWAKSFFHEKGALVGAIFYLFSPYLFVDLYIRGSVGEVWALAFFPAFLWSITQLIYKDKRIFLPVSIVFLALIIFSHNILALMFFPFAISYSLLLIFLSKKRKILIINLLVLIILGLGLSAIFWLPAVLETKYTVGLQIYDYKNNFPAFYQLLFPSWGSGFFGGNLANQMSVQIGIANLLVISISIVVFIKLFRKKDFRAKLLGFFLASLFIVIFLMLKTSLPIWENIPFMNYFQFPWRFLSLTILFSSFLAAGIFSTVKQKLFFITMLFLPIIFTLDYMHPAYYMDRTDSYYATRPNFIDGTNSIGNSFNTLWFHAKPVRVNSKIDASSIKGKIISQKIGVNSYIFNLDLKSDSKIIINTAYFPGWQAFVDGKASKISITSTGLIELFVPKNIHTVRISFGDTPIRQVSSIISLISLLGLITLFIRKWYIKNT
jgi:hypothetical protein